ncbi:MAG: hypothetical protein H0X17_04025 [Deltaproteobacteria bacterium]|nr:hypothetical protein [Deltaproteobacteria bacterium]
MRSLLLPSILLSLMIPTAALAQPGQPPPPPPPPPGYAPAYAQPAPQAMKQGLTFEANLGVGFIWADPDEGAESDKELALAGLSLGVGGWLSPQLALTLRIAGVTYSEEIGDDTGRLTTGFFGPSAQYWVNENAWLGGGLGLGFASISVGDFEDSESGLGLDLRGGYTFSTTSENTWNLSVELTPSFLDGGTLYGFGILLGYQHL